jgi:predicted RNase H-like HicB family nuclease
MEFVFHVGMELCPVLGHLWNVRPVIKHSSAFFRHVYLEKAFSSLNAGVNFFFFFYFFIIFDTHFCEYFTRCQSVCGIVSAMNGMSQYCKDALKLAVVKNPEAGGAFSANIPGIAGIIVFAPTRGEVMAELKSALEGWVELSLARGDGLPALHDLAVVA